MNSSQQRQRHVITVTERLARHDLSHKGDHDEQRVVAGAQAFLTDGVTCEMVYAYFGLANEEDLGRLPAGWRASTPVPIDDPDIVHVRIDLKAPGGRLYQFFLLRDPGIETLRFRGSGSHQWECWGPTQIEE